MFSIAILTFNEEVTIDACLKSVEWADDVLVFDSFSSDRTVAIANLRKVRVIQHPFEGFARQRNACLEHGNFKYPWVFMLDADERFTPALRSEVEATVLNVPSDVAMFRVRRKDYFLGRWIPRAALYPTWHARLMRHANVRVTREVNEQFEADGRVGRLKEHFAHFPFAKDLAGWVARHNRYADMEAEQLLMDTLPLRWHALLDRDPVVRRIEFKRLAYRLPARPLAILIYLLIARGAIFEGFPGISYSALRAWYELCIDIKCQELRMKQANSGHDVTT